MKTSTSTTRLSWILTFLFLLTMISAQAGDHNPGFPSAAADRAWGAVHSLSGILILVGALVHLRLHWSWIRQVIFGHARNPGGAIRRNRAIDTVLFGAGALCALSGPPALLFPHGMLVRLHHVSGSLMGIMILVHIASHHKWYAATMRRAIEGWSRSLGDRRSEA